MLIHWHQDIKPCGFDRYQKSSVIKASEARKTGGLALVFME